MKLWEALKIHEETGRQIKPVDQKYYDQYLNWNIANHINSEWMVEPEPKKTVVMYKWAISHGGTYWVESSDFYKDEEFIKRSYPTCTNIKRLDYTATEFEV